MQLQWGIHKRHLSLHSYACCLIDIRDAEDSRLRDLPMMSLSKFWYVVDTSNYPPSYCKEVQPWLE